MHVSATEIPGYTYGTPAVGSSSASMDDLQRLKVATGFNAEDERYLQLAGAVLGDQVEAIVKHWRAGIIAGIPHLARHSRKLDGSPLPDYLARSNRRFEQWILDTCLRPYDQDWLNYQQEIALRHTSAKKNQTDHADSTSHVPYSDIVAFVAVLNETIRPYLQAKGHAEAEVTQMHAAWCKSMHMQMALWAKPYMEMERAGREW
ncbi:protoglobin domain-containing protein [Dyella acidiphila]|uniref:Protogloblin ApPgb n=1 Tax=Dyella acidiphila TaxID=2775866 RepID=A0ABR9GE94_9GAMM|nr:protoglobin domain-containing protein [Dyella acidiphila]MBE1162378.1 protogloblin ApPgb [Dyella acidiphila]